MPTYLNLEFQSVFSNNRDFHMDSFDGIQRRNVGLAGLGLHPSYQKDAIYVDQRDMSTIKL